MENNTDFNRLLGQACRFLAHRPRSEFEMKEYLKTKPSGEKHEDQIIRHLKSRQYIDDHSFAEWFIRQRTQVKPRSKFAIRYELKQKKIPAHIYEPLLTSFDDYALAVSCITPVLNRWQTLDDTDVKKKMTNYLRYRGFSYNVCNRIYEELGRNRKI